MQPFEILLPLALILLLAKVFSLLGKKLGLPEVVGMLLAGILLGFIKLIPGQTIFTGGIPGGPTGTLDGLSFLSKIGVIFIMFSAGIGTDVKQFKKIGLPSVIITLLGVIVPMVLGFVVAWGFRNNFGTMGQHDLLTNFFYGAVLAATSVSITVASLKELGKLNSKVGMSIVAAAILDDIIGIVLLSLFIGIDTTGSASNIGEVIGMMIAFFAAAIVVGILIRLFVKNMSKRHPHTRRIPIISFVVCFVYAYAAEKFFGVADITGAYVAGLVLAGLNESEYIDKKVEQSNYLIFAPVFFASIGINANFTGITPEIVGFGFCFILAGMIGKIIGCGAGALMCRYGVKDSLRVGVGMMVRAEVVLVCAQKGIDAANPLFDSSMMPFILIMIIATSLLTPLILKLSYRKERNAIPPLDGGVSPEEQPDDAPVVASTENFLSDIA